MFVIIVHVHGVEIIFKKIGGKVAFLGGFNEPLGQQRERKYLGHLNVKGL